jgi:RimJ/RimL family protein N-acetyltransferase
MNRVTIHDVTRANWRATLALAVRSDQRQFVAAYTPIAAIILSKAYVGAEGMRWEPCAFSADGALVGMAALASEPERPALIWLYHFFIDERSQGQGYGREALAALISRVNRRQPPCQSLLLTAHPKNHVAQRLYTGMGFAPTGDEREGEPVYRLALRQSDE